MNVPIKQYVVRPSRNEPGWYNVVAITVEGVASVMATCPRKQHADELAEAISDKKGLKGGGQ